jgi:hypothetical protein
MPLYSHLRGFNDRCPIHPEQLWLCQAGPRHTNHGKTHLSKIEKIPPPAFPLPSHGGSSSRQHLCGGTFLRNERGVPDVKRFRRAGATLLSWYFKED